ncbi:MAG: glycine dehydrogenase, partial [Anaerolineaceae bacterium 4572_32.2]
TVGAESVDEFFQEVPDELRFKDKMDLPEPFLSEYALKRHVEGLLSKNRAAGECLNFLGAGCYQHHVPAVCDEINRRAEFLTAYAGEPYDDHGRFQTLFEYASMMGELLNMDVVNVPTYDGYQATATALRMAARLTGRPQALICGSIATGRLAKIRDYCRPVMQIELLGYDAATGQLDLNALRAAISNQTAAVYFENPSYLGFIETQGREISQISHRHGAISVVGVDPISLGVLTPPADYGADIVCGDIQPLGMHMQYGGGQAGFIATRDEEKYVMEYPSRLFGIAPTSVPGEYGFGDVAYDRTSFARREKGKEWVGTAAAYAMTRLTKIEGVRAPLFDAPHFQEFVVNFDGTGKSVAQINAALLERGIFGGKDLSAEFPALGQSALYCLTEIHSKDDIDQLTGAVKEVIA